MGEVKDNTKSLMMLLIVWEVFTFGEVYLGSYSLILIFYKRVLIPTSLRKRCVCTHLDMSALLELQFCQMPLDLNFPCRVRLLETSYSCLFDIFCYSAPCAVVSSALAQHIIPTSFNP